MVDLLRSLLVPFFCYYCHVYLERDEPFCDSCGTFPLLLSVPMQIGPDDALIVYALSINEDPLKLVLNKRFKRDYAFWVQMGTLLYRVYKKYLLPGDLLLPVPDDSASYTECGFRKTLVMAQQLSRLSGVPLIDAIKLTQPLVQRPYCSTREWYEFLQKSFEITPLPPHKRVVLIDVSLVTGATLSVFARELRKTSVQPIHALVLCRALKPSLGLSH